MIATAFATALALACLGAGDDSPEGRALAYLAAEVPRWSAEHHCYSCHNNGDAARALYQGLRLGRPVPPAATLDTDRWLARPEKWDRNGGEGPFSDRRLARLQFASALASAVEAGRSADRAPLLLAADRLADDQAADGSWPVDDGGRVGSPATYGRPLGTWLAREVLRSADAPRHRARIDRADAWLRLQPFPSVMDASTLLLAGAFADSPEGQARRDQALGLLRRARSPDCGWGPFENAPPEAFDTALALLALDRHRDRLGVPALIAGGRSYLAETQQPDGSWPETTRPPGAESYAQRLSTTAWAAQALLATRVR